MNSSSDEQFDLQNDHNVYILGAGFSAFRGIPLIRNFMHCMRDAHAYMTRQGRAEEADAIASVLKFRRDSAAAAYRIQVDLENIEELYSLASIVGDAYSKDLRLAIASTIDFAQRVRAEPRTVVQRDKREKFELPKNWTAIPQPNVNSLTYENFDAPSYEVLLHGLTGYLSGKAEVGANSFLSFNYDLLAEDAFSSLGQPFSYGFSSDLRVEPDPRKLLMHQVDSPLKLLKLHGSMNWGIPESAGGPLRLFCSYDDLRKNGLIPQLVPPTWRKSVTPLLQGVWAEAVEALRRATRIIVIGFSIPPTDLHFKYLIAAGLRRNVSLRNIVFYDAASESLLPRVQQLFSDLNRLPKVEVFQR